MSKTRLCRQCKIDKPIEEFYEDRRVKKDGRRSRCIQCLTSGNPPGPIPMNPLTRYKINEKGYNVLSNFEKGILENYSKN